MTFAEYLDRLSFVVNPFQFSNADKEVDYIDQYFIEPDYFEAVWGTPANPVSSIIYAPRGGGKTAQRIMIEKRAKGGQAVLPITYANHDLSQFKSIDDVDLTYHLVHLNRLLLVGLFSRIGDPEFNFNFTYSFSERQYIYKLARVYLYDTPASFPNQAVASLKTFEDYIKGLWDNFKTPIVSIIKSISKSKGLEVDLSTVELDKKLELSHRDNLKNIVHLLNKADYESIYVLVDKVDEQSLTGNNPENSFKLIEPLIKDLELLETPGMCFKFFLWDALISYTNVIARPDRVFAYNLHWSISQIKTMLNRRVQAYSGYKVQRFSNLFAEAKSQGRVIIFSQLSPRDCVRICNRILTEQHNANPNHVLFQPDVVNLSIDKFAKERAEELVLNPSNRQHLSKIGRVTFTIEELVTNKVASDTSAARNIILPWTTAEYVKKIGTRKRTSAKAVNEYAFTDIRLARYACPTLSLDEFLTRKVRRCVEPTCTTIYLRDFDRTSYSCPNCNTANP